MLLVASINGKGHKKDPDDRKKLVLFKQEGKNSLVRAEWIKKKKKKVT